MPKAQGCTGVGDFQTFTLFPPTLRFLMRERIQPCLIYHLADVPLIKMFSDRDIYFKHSGGCYNFLSKHIILPITEIARLGAEGEGYEIRKPLHGCVQEGSEQG